jgi:L-alanine-DL-glutamate epimerase-like enolase superfamily enzyme
MSMRIREVRAIALERDLEQVFQGGTYQITNRYTIVTEVVLTNGVRGVMFGGDEWRWQKEIVSLINDHFNDLLAGADALNVEQHWDAMFQCKALEKWNRSIHVLDLANRAVQMQAIAAVDIALWDALGKAMQKPVYQLLGGYRERVPVLAIGGYYAENKGEKELAEELRGYQRTGVAGIKLKVGHLTPKEDAERVGFVREVAGTDFVIACDANQAWTCDEAIEFCGGARQHNLRWLEEPVQWQDQLGALAEVRKRGGIPICAGQGEISRFGCRDLMLAGAVDILNVDATIAGGITEWRRVAGMAGMMNVAMGHHEEPQVALHLLASVPHALYVEIFPNPERDPMWFELPVQQPRIESGFMHLSSAPGLGIDLREDVVERYRAVRGVTVPV